MQVSAQVAYDYVRLMKNQEHYNKWVMADPAAYIGYSGTDGEVGCVVLWDSKNKNVGKGEQEIKALLPGKEIRLEIRFERPFKGVSHSVYHFEPAGANACRVSTLFLSDTPFPMNIFSSLMKGMLRKDMHITLGNLKSVLEK